MLTSRVSRAGERRGIVLVLVLAMLGLLALVGVTFATFAGQARINNRSYMESILQAQADELFDFGLSQLITDTNDIRSAIRGHSLARDMYGTGALSNGLVTSNPNRTYSQDGLLHITGVATTVVGGQTYYNLTTNISLFDPNFYGYNFTRWIIRLTYSGSIAGMTPPVDQTMEINFDDSTGAVNANYHVFRVLPFDAVTTLYNPTQGTISQQAMQQLNNPLVANAATQNIANYPFILDGRWLHAFNGPGMGASSSSITGTSNAVYGNFRYNAALNPTVTNFSPNTYGMDEDYDACDLENWFLAIQSADGQVMIPSFHRPAVIRYDVSNNVDDWLRHNQANPAGGSLFADSAARILRPCNNDGHDPATFPDLKPDLQTGQITYDVDNDSDGQRDSVWVDLGYPARRDGSGRLYKPMFAFMVIGLNGRIPLNTAGNLANGTAATAVTLPTGSPIATIGAGAGHALHLGNTISEIDPTYALQNAFLQTTDQYPAFAQPQGGIFVNGAMTATFANNSQVDNAGFDVRLTQLRNLLAGTRPNDASGTTGDLNYVLYHNASQAGQKYHMPNGIVDLGDTYTTDASGNIYATRTNQAVPGRWGEGQAVPGLTIPNPLYTPGSGLTQFYSVVTTDYHNPVRAGYSMDPSDIANNNPRDGADDNYNSFDPYPEMHTGEAGDLDMYDAVGALVLPVDRMRRWLTPADINGTGRVRQWQVTSGGPDRGGDWFGRVEYQSYFRPPGSPGTIVYNPAAGSGINVGTIYYGNYAGGAETPWVANSSAYTPDVTNNPLHGFEAFHFPNQSYTANATAPAANTASGAFTPQSVGGAPADLNLDQTNTATNVPTLYPTYDYQVNATVHSDGLNDADEQNLYTPNPLLDAPFGPSDLEWLYRLQDVDGPSLSSRLSQLAPVSLTNGLDGARRRKLFAVDGWDTNKFVWANDNPSNAFSSNHTFGQTQSAGFTTLGVGTPSIAHRDNRINLNFPLPVSNDPNEPIRQKWISETYYLLKAVLPPSSVDTAEELAELSQFVINIIDFRDPDCTMTHWVNPDVQIAGVPLLIGATPPATTPLPTTAPTLIKAGATLPGSQPTTVATTTLTTYAGTVGLDQFGMEYNPVAINEAIAYSYSYNATGTGATSNRFLMELVNTLTSPEMGTGSTNASVLDLGGFQYTLGDPYSGGAWDVVFTADDAYSRPEPHRGQLLPCANIYGLTPLNQDSFKSTYTNPTGGPMGAPLAVPISQDVILQPLLPDKTGANGTSVPVPVAPNFAGTNPLPLNYFYVFGNLPAASTTGGTTTTYEYAALQPGTYYGTTGYTTTPITGGQAVTYTTGGLNGYQIPVGAPAVLQSLNATSGFDPMTNAGGMNPTINLYQGVLPFPAMQQVATGNPVMTTLPPNYKWKIPTIGAPTATGGQRLTEFIWVCLRRPANPFAPVSLANPMVVVDSMRVPYIDGTGSNVTTDPTGNPAVNNIFNTIYSAQRFQPYRGGHAVPPPQATLTNFSPVPPVTALDARYGYTEQMVPPSLNSASLRTQGIYYTSASATNAATYPILHTLGWANEYEMGSGSTTSTTVDTWEMLPFHDRDFTSVAELMFVPACPPGLFTKQFVEFAPSLQNYTSYFSVVAPQQAPGVAVNQTPAVTSFTRSAGTTTIPTVPTIGVYGLAPGGLTTAGSTGLPGSFTMTSAPLGTASGTTVPIQPPTHPYLSDKFYYTGFGSGATIDIKNSTVDGYAADGWFKMFEFMEVPSQALGAIGPVATGTNFDWARQDTKPGLINLNLIIDEEVFLSVLGKQSIAQQNGQYVDSTGTAQLPSDQFSQQHLNFDQITNFGQTKPLPAGYYSPFGVAYATATGPPYALPLAAGSPPVPFVVTSILANGTPNSAYPMMGTGMLAADPIMNFGTAATTFYNNALKASFVQFLTLRHGGSGYMFGFGSGAVGQNLTIKPPDAGDTAPLMGVPSYVGIPAEIPFHSLSYPDIDYTVMRPAALPPTTFTNPQSNNVLNLTGTAPYYSGDPGVRNPNLYTGHWTTLAPGQTGIATGASIAVTYNPVLPPPIPARRLFQVPDAYAPTVMSPLTTNPTPSNASEVGDPFINSTIPVVPAAYTGTVPLPATGALPPVSVNSVGVAGTVSFNNGVPSLYWPNNLNTPTPPSTGSAGTAYPAVGTASNIPTAPGASPPRSPLPGANNSAAAAYTSADFRQHPYWRYEEMQRIMNLTTVRTHQFAVWMTIGFFEVKRQGDLGMLAFNPALAFDILGPEIGAANGKSVRYRGFFVVDRLQVTGFNPSSPTGFRQAVVYRQRIQ